MAEFLCTDFQSYRFPPEPGGSRDGAIGRSRRRCLGQAASHQIHPERIGAAPVATGDAPTAEYPKIATFFAHYHLPAGDLQQLMLQAHDSSADQVVADYYAALKQMFTDMFAGKN